MSATEREMLDMRTHSVLTRSAAWSRVGPSRDRGGRAIIKKSRLLDLVGGPMLPGAPRRRRALVVASLVVALTSVVSTADTIVYGPKTYSGTGLPVLKTDSFNVQTAGAGYRLHIANKGVRFALVVINGRIVL